MDGNEVQLKVLCMQAAAGDILKAQELFTWISESYIQAEVRRRIQQYLDSKRVDSAP